LKTARTSSRAIVRTVSDAGVALMSDYQSNGRARSQRWIRSRRRA
jgi:hypothetical protein